MKKVLIVILISIFLLTSCSLPGIGNKSGEDAAVAALQATMDAQNAAATLAAMPVNTAEPPTAEPTVAAPTETATPEPTATPTEIPVVKVTTTSNANCRLGPDKTFALVELLNAGTTALVIGQLNTNGQWWKVRTDTGKECWLLGSNVNVTGDTSIVAFLEAPPTPTPVPPPSWAGDWNARISTNFTDPEKNVAAVPIEIKQNGNIVSSYFTVLTVNISFSGTVSADGMSVLGTMQYGTPWTFKIRLYRVPGNLNQFQGEFYDGKFNGTPLGSDGAFCAGMKGAQPPSPCRPQ